jgi:hypothetical protein
MQYDLFNYDNPDLLSEEEKKRLQFYVDLEKANSRSLNIGEDLEFFKYIFENKESVSVTVNYDEDDKLRIILKLIGTTDEDGFVIYSFGEGEREGNEFWYLQDAIYKIDVDLLATLDVIQTEIFENKCIFNFFKLLHDLMDIETEVLDNDKMRKKVKREILKQKI